MEFAERTDYREVNEGMELMKLFIELTLILYARAAFSVTRIYVKHNNIEVQIARSSRERIWQ